MKIPKALLDRDEFFRDIIYKCEVSLASRKVDYASLRNWYLFGNGPDEAPALYNKIFPHIDQLTSFLLSRNHQVQHQPGGICARQRAQENPCFDQGAQ